MFIVLTTVAIFFGYHMNWIRQRHDAIQSCAYHLVPAEAPGVLWLFGEQGYSDIWIETKNKDPSPTEERRESERVARLFPEAKNIVVTYWEYGVHR